MPKMKTKGSIKKRFRMTATGKITSGKVGKRHGMIKRSSKQIRQLRGTRVVHATGTKKIRQLAPYGL